MGALPSKYSRDIDGRQCLKHHTDAIMCYNALNKMGGIIINSNKTGGEKKREGLREKVIALLMLLLVIAITVAIFIYRNAIAGLGSYGYLSAFLVCLISNTSVILPVPGIVILFALGTTLNPVLVGLAGAAGGIIGEVTGFILGYGGRRMVQSRNKTYARAENWMRRWGGWTVFVFAAVPLPVFDIAGVVAGVLRYPLWKFLLIGWVGKSIKYVILVMVGSWGWGAILRYFA